MRVAKRGRWTRRPSILVAAAVVAGAGFVMVPTTLASAAPTPACADATNALLGLNVCVFTPSMAESAIQADLNAIAVQQVPITAQFDSNRYALFFAPGTYGTSADPLVFQVGYYTQVAGLGALPQDTVINGQIDAFANALQCSGSYCWENSTDNFWRSLSNLQLNVIGDPADLTSPPLAQALPPISNPGAANCYGGNNDFWSVSQAAPLRRVLVNGNIVFQAFCTATGYGGTDYASGGFVADSQVSGSLDFYGNQQYYVRNSVIGGSAGAGPGGQGLWNNVYSGVTGAPGPVFAGQSLQNTVLGSTPRSEEQPFLYTDSTGTKWSVFVPAVQTNSSGTSWASGGEAGSSVPLSSFFVANPSTPIWQIDAALAFGKNLLLTPGIYNLDAPIVAPHSDTVIIGLGFATLMPQRGNAAIIAVSNQGVEVSGLIVDAGPVNSPVLMSVGTPGLGWGKNRDTASDPDLISDVFFRIGGAETTPTSADVSLLDNADNSIIDDVWAWRADHNQGGTTSWTYNKGEAGVIVTGDNVVATGLLVEHYEMNEVIWSGQNGTEIFFQNELPYDVPSQAAWMATPTQDGYPAFLVTNNVKSFTGYGMGSYVVFTNTPAASGSNSLYDQEAFEAPHNPGIQFNNILTVWIAGNGGDNSIINGIGGPDTSTNPGVVEPVDLASYTG
ncbi:MAG TPA: adenylyl cyclase [Candidatus Binatia bacterium]|nr:adenylyl cyclase [Candidatus Binatia bacterium]